MQVTVDDPEKLETLRADGQGRVSLGVEYAGRAVKVLVAESEAEQSEERGAQQIIGGEPMADHERKGMTFVRVFGIDPEYLSGNDESNTDDDAVDRASVNRSHVDWSEGVVIDEDNVARFEFRTDDGDERFGDQFTASAEAVEADEDTYGKPVYCYANEDGDVSAIDQGLVEKVSRVFGSDPLEELSRVRLHPEKADHPVVFEDAAGETRIVVAPRIQD